MPHYVIQHYCFDENALFIPFEANDDTQAELVLRDYFDSLKPEDKTPTRWIDVSIFEMGRWSFRTKAFSTCIRKGIARIVATPEPSEVEQPQEAP